VSDAGYLVAIKPSARRASPAVGQWVNDEGPRRRFDSKDDARGWAEACSSGLADTRPAAADTGDSAGRVLVWIQDAVPTDGSDADGYLVAGERGSGSEAPATGTQAVLDDEATTRE
jgi:hypothetical protein